eukprot:767899-Hanusia_phi.AAC.1
MAILYRTQKTGRTFQQELLKLDIPFNVHGVSFWRRKVALIVSVRAFTTLPDCQVFQACRRLIKGFLYQEIEATEAILNHLEKFANSRHISLWQSAQQVLRAKFSGSLSKKLVVST